MFSINPSTGRLEVTPTGEARLCHCPSDCTPVERACPLGVTEFPTIVNVVFDDISSCVTGEVMAHRINGHKFCMQPDGGGWVAWETVGGRNWVASYWPSSTGINLDGGLQLLLQDETYAWMYHGVFHNDHLPRCELGGTYDSLLLEEDCYLEDPIPNYNRYYFGGTGRVFTTCEVHIATWSAERVTCTDPAGYDEVTYLVTVHNSDHDGHRGAILDYSLTAGATPIATGSAATNSSGVATIVSPCVCEDPEDLRLIITDIYGPIVWAPGDDEVEQPFDVALLCGP